MHIASVFLYASIGAAALMCDPLYPTYAFTNEAAFPYICILP